MTPEQVKRIDEIVLGGYDGKRKDSSPVRAM
jgi:hypothetical protein